MSLISQDFERRARALVQEEIGRSPELRAEFKRLRKTESNALARSLRRILMPLFWNCIFLNVALKTRDVSLTAAVITLWAAATVFRWGYHWFQQFYASEDLVVLNLLPLDDRQIFRFQTKRYLLAAGWTVWEMLLAYGVLGIVGNGEIPWLYLPLAALTQSVLILALALHVASRLHMLPLNGVAGLFYATAFAVLLLGTRDSSSTGYVVQATQWLLPTGWLNYILLQVQRDYATLGLLVPIAAIIYLARFSWDRLRNYYSLEGFEILPSSSRHAATAEDEELSSESSTWRVGPTEMEERIAARSFLLGVNWETSGWLERLASRFLNARERVITEFLVAQDPGWSRSFRWSFWVWIVSCLIILLLGQFGGTLVFFTAYLLVTSSLPLFGGDWRGMRQSHAGGVNLPGFALYPISFNSIARIFLKINFIRIFAALPFLLSFSALAAWKLKENPFSGLLLCAQLLGVLLVLQPVFILFPISSTTNDTSRMRMIWFFVFLPVLLLIVASALGIFLSRNVGQIVLCYIFLLMFSTLLFSAYRRAYRRGRFDLFNRRNAPVG